MVELDLLGGVHHVVVAPNDRVDAHRDVVDHHREVVGGAAVAAADDEVVQLFVLEGDRPLDHVVEHRGAGKRRLEAHGRAWAGAEAPVAASAVVLRLAARGERLLAHLFDALGRAGAIIGVAGVEELLNVFAVDREPPGLEIGALIPVDAEPLERLENGVHILLPGPFDVGVLEAQHEAAFHASRVEPVEDRRAGAAQVQVAGRARWEAGDDLGHAVHLIAWKAPGRQSVACRSLEKKFNGSPCIHGKKDGRFSHLQKKAIVNSAGLGARRQPDPSLPPGAPLKAAASLQARYG